VPDAQYQPGMTVTGLTGVAGARLSTVPGDAESVPTGGTDLIPGSTTGTKHYFDDDQNDGDFNDVQITVNDATVGDEMVTEASIADNEASVTTGIFGPVDGVDYGADGAEPNGSYDVFAFAAEADMSLNGLQGLASDGTYGDVSLVRDGDTALRGVVNEGTPAAEDIFTLSLNGDDTYTFDLLRAVRHPDLDGAPNNDVVALNISGAILTYDHDGDPVALDFGIRIQDGVPLLASNDPYDVNPGDSVPILLADLLANGGSPDGVDLASVTVTDDGGSGTVGYDPGTGTFTYTADNAGSGTTSFTYRVEDADGDTAEGTVTINIL